MRDCCVARGNIIVQDLLINYCGRQSPKITFTLMAPQCVHALYDPLPQVLVGLVIKMTELLLCVGCTKSQRAYDSYPCDYVVLCRIVLWLAGEEFSLQLCRSKLLLGENAGLMHTSGPSLIVTSD